MSGKSLRGQLTRASMVTTLVALLLSAGALLAYELSTYRHAFVADLSTQADLIAQSTAAALVFDDPKVAQESLGVLRLQSRIRAAAVYRNTGPAFAAYTAAPEETTPAQTDAVFATTGFRFDGATLELIYPIVHDTERVGTLYLRARHDVWARAIGYGGILGLVVLTSLALALYLFGRLQRRVTTPLVKMTAVAQEVMASRNWSLRAPETEYHDVAVLVHAFNGMLSECETRTTELEQEMVERKNAEQELRLADRRKDEFLATLAHELRNPLAPMTSAVALVQMSHAPQAARDKALVIMERQLRHMVRLIDDLLDVSRLRTGKLSLHRQRLDAAMVLRTTVELAEPAAVHKGLALLLQMPDEPLVIDGDAARLAQVFSNLLSNACRYTPAGGRIDVVAQRRDAQLEISFRDTGIGVDPALQSRIFELFEQADKSLERGNAGLGVGLTLARQLVQLHGGEIAVDSAGLGHGSCFTVRLPLVESPAAAATPPGANVEPAVRALRILLADDNLDFTASTSALLRSMGHEVEVVDDGAAAVQAAKRGCHDIGLFDIGMPRLNGYDAARQVRADPAIGQMVLVAVTGWGQAADKAAAVDAGFDRHLVKPVTPDDLLKVLAQASTRVSST